MREKIGIIAFLGILALVLAISGAIPLSYGGNAAIPINVINTQSATVPSGFQQMIYFNPSAYSSYVSNDLGNIRFYANVIQTPANELYSWCESNCTTQLSITTYFVYITANNPTAYATETPFQQFISYNALKYSKYEAGDLGNIRFYLKGTHNPANELYSWCESNCTNQSQSTQFWINLPNGISGSGNVIINMTFMNKTSGSFEYDGNYAGEAPQYGLSYDNGGKVFLSYANASYSKTADTGNRCGGGDYQASEQSLQYNSTIITTALSITGGQDYNGACDWESMFTVDDPITVPNAIIESNFNITSLDSPIPNSASDIGVVGLAANTAIVNQSGKFIGVQDGFFGVSETPAYFFEDYLNDTEPAILKIGTNGIEQPFYPSSQTNVSKGTALADAFLHLTTGDQIYAQTGNYDIQSFFLSQAAGNTAGYTNIGFYGAGVKNTRIISSVQLDCAIVAGINSITSDMSIYTNAIYTGSTTNDLCGWGSGQQPAGFMWGNATLRNVYTQGFGEGIYASNPPEYSNSAGYNIILQNTTANVSRFGIELGASSNTIKLLSEDSSFTANGVIYPVGTGVASVSDSGGDYISVNSIYLAENGITFTDGFKGISDALGYFYGGKVNTICSGCSNDIALTLASTGYINATFQYNPLKSSLVFNTLGSFGAYSYPKSPKEMPIYTKYIYGQNQCGTNQSNEWLYSEINFSRYSPTYNGYISPNLYDPSAAPCSAYGIVPNSLQGINSVYIAPESNTSIDNNYDGNLDINYNWIRARSTPPEGIMPTISFNSAVISNTITTQISNSVFWVKLSNSIGPSSNTIIYLSFLPTNTEYDGNYAGEAPGQSQNYAKYDNGNQVFNFYDNFSGTAISNKWTFWTGGSGNINVDNGLVIPGTMQAGMYGTTSGFNALSNTVDAYDYYTSETYGGDYMGFVGSGGNSPYLAVINNGDITPGQGYAMYEDETGCEQTINGGSNSNYNIFTVMPNSIAVSGQLFYANKTTLSGACYDVPTSKEYPFFYHSSSDSGDLIAQWIRVRDTPPNMVMPSINYGGPTSTSSTSTTSISTTTITAITAIPPAGRAIPNPSIQQNIILALAFGVMAVVFFLLPFLGIIRRDGGVVYTIILRAASFLFAFAAFSVLISPMIIPYPGYIANLSGTGFASSNVIYTNYTITQTLPIAEQQTYGWLMVAAAAVIIGALVIDMIWFFLEKRDRDKQ